MNRADLLTFMRTQRWAVLSSVSPDGEPQAALVGIVTTNRLEIFFDTTDTTRKFTNLVLNPRVAIVVGGWTDGDERTVQYEGVADVPSGEDMEELKLLYLSVFPDGREREKLPSIAYFRVTPEWLRYSDFRKSPPEIQEFQFP